MCVECASDHLMAFACVILYFFLQLCSKNLRNRVPSCLCTRHTIPQLSTFLTLVYEYLSASRLLITLIPPDSTADSTSVLVRGVLSAVNSPHGWALPHVISSFTRPSTIKPNTTRNYNGTTLPHVSAHMVQIVNRTEHNLLPRAHHILGIIDIPNLSPSTTSYEGNTG